MLEQLKLSNLALSNQAEVDFTPGMICITGETGAGKSLVVDALSLVLGAKADSNLVRQGRKQMEVSALFSIEHNPQVHRLLEAYGFAEEKSSFSRAVANGVSKSRATRTDNIAHSSHEDNVAHATHADNIAHISQIESPAFLVDNAQANNTLAKNNGVINKTAKVQALAGQTLSSSITGQTFTSSSTEQTLLSSNTAQALPPSITELTQSINATNKDNTLQTVALADSGKLEQDVCITREHAVPEVQVVNGSAVFAEGEQAVLPKSSKIDSLALQATQAVNDDSKNTANGVVTSQELGNAAVRDGIIERDQEALAKSNKEELTEKNLEDFANGVKEGKEELVQEAIELRAMHAVVADGQAEDIPFASMHALGNRANQEQSALGKVVETQHKVASSQDLELANFKNQQESLSLDSQQNAQYHSLSLASQQGSKSKYLSPDSQQDAQQGSCEQDQPSLNLTKSQSQVTKVACNVSQVEQEDTLEQAKKHEQECVQNVVNQTAYASSDFAAEYDAKDDAADDADDDTEDSELILRRVVSAEGKSKAYINGHMATLSQLREISECLVAIHGQHASVKLMDEKQQLEIVDNFGKLKPLVSKVNHAFNEYAALRQQLTQLSESQKIGAQAYKQERYELEELKRLALKEGDYEELEANFDKAMHQAQFMYAVSGLYNLIENSDSSITSLLRERQSELDKVKSYDPAIVPLLESIDTALMNLYECSARAEDLMAQDMELSSAELEERMSKVHELSRRFACAPQDLYLMTERLEQKVNQFLGLKDQINALTQKVKESRQAYELLCDELTVAREQAARMLATQIGERIKALSLPDARFDIVMTRDNEGRPRLNGRDNLCFMFSANLGQDLKPLSAVASGGELSRLALIIEVLTASVKSTPTLIFDEVDTGISGRTASAVGSLLKELGQYVQVITVTHLPQVAAKANTQFVVAKYNEDGQVNSTISLLDDQGRIEEISRMIGGSVITDTTRSSAYELLNDM